ncbi:VanZ family protein [Streptomyces sp. TRM76323]|uniref:VanZ family protein n=1 Tax=Streptomyces tamarix TaxID=3078565 RepID=A0ABU3QHA9_9ACTN|nr:VanZ family protein [Streptomyces tamarix]MDT9682086.1 VanZ family protein [Streptomyces tamarix]
MFTAIFQDHYGYLAACTLAALALGIGAWLLARRLRSPHGVWFAGLAATVAGVLSVTFMGSGPASGQCVINHDVVEPFRTTQGLWNLTMTVPLGFFALMAVRCPLPVLVGVVTFPLGIEVVQAEVDGLGRVCDSADAQMNILGGLIGLTVAVLVLLKLETIEWKGAARASLFASLAVVLLGSGVAYPAMAFTHIDGTGLSQADDNQRQAVEHAVKEAFGDRYKLGPVYDQPCVGVPCRNVAFTLLSRDTAHPEQFANGTLSWPDKNRFNVLLQDSDRPSAMGYPVTGSKPPTTDDAAYEVAQAYMRERYPWGADATVHKTYPVGGKAELGWITSWRWIDDGVLMPRMLDVQVSRVGTVSQVDVSLGPEHLDLDKPKLDAKKAESLVREALAEQLADRGGVPDDMTIKAFTLKAVDRDGIWRPTWLVNISQGTRQPAPDIQTSGMADIWRVDSLNGHVYDGADQLLKEN